MLPASLWLLCLSAIGARATTTPTSSKTTTSPSSTSPGTDDFYSTSFSTLPSIPASLLSSFSGSKFTYTIPTGQSTVATYTPLNSTQSQTTVSVSKHTRTILGGTRTRTATLSAQAAQNTLPCNGWPEFCNRQYSNITYVCAHNSAFVLKDNAGSNQALPVTDQLDDGIRMGKSLTANPTGPKKVS